MNRLPTAKRLQILNLLCRGASLRGITRVTGVSINTVTKLIVECGTHCTALHARLLRNLAPRRLYCCRVWTPLSTPMSTPMSTPLSTPRSTQRSRASRVKASSASFGTWTWVAIDTDSGLIVAFRVGDDGPRSASQFAGAVSRGLTKSLKLKPTELASALDAGRPFTLQLGKDGNIATSPGADAMPKHSAAHRLVSGRFTRLRNAYARKLANLRHVSAIYVTWYNFVRLPRGAATPAVGAGLIAQRWKPEALLPAPGRARTSVRRG